MMWTATRDMAWDAATAVSAVSYAMLETLRRSTSAEDQCCLREELRAAGQGIFQRLKFELSLLYCNLLDPIKREQMRTNEAISRALVELVVHIESILNADYVGRFSTQLEDTTAGRKSDALTQVHKVETILRGGRGTFVLELAIKPDRATNLAGLLPVLKKFNSVVDDDDPDDIHQQIEDTKKLKQKLRQDSSSIQGIMNTLHRALHGQWPCPQHIKEYSDEEPDSSFALGRCVEAYMELDSRWILPGNSGPLNDAFVILKGREIAQLCELNYVASKTS